MLVQLNVEELRQNTEWAFLTATPVTRDGGPIDYSKTIYAKDVRQGFFDDWLCALVHKASGAAWSVVALSIGATDAPFVDWPERFGVPVEIVIPKHEVTE